MGGAFPNRITDVMQQRSPLSLSWTELLVALRGCAGEEVLIRDGKLAQPAVSVQNRQSAKGTELCLFPGEQAVRRLELIEKLESLAKGAGRRFVTSARARINGSTLIVKSVTDENVDGVLFAVLNTRRPKLGFNRSQQTGDTTTFRNKRIKNR